MDINTMIMQLLIALFAWAFVWIQREMYINEQKDELEFSWMRTNIFLAVLWVVSTFFTTMPYLPVILFFAILVLIWISHAAWSFKLGRPWMTSELSAFLIFWVWVLIGFGQEAIAIILVIILTWVNTFRSHIDSFVDALNHKEWLAALQLLVFSWAVLPILPNKPITDLLEGTKFELVKTKIWEELTFQGLAFDVLADINLFKVWLFVLFISWIGFVGYFLSKFIWAKWGIPIAAFLWALSSSTAVTVSLAGQEKDAQKSKFSELTSLIFAGWILIWISTMMLRVILWIFVIWGLSLGYWIFYIPLAMAIFSALLAVYYMKKYNKEAKKAWGEKADIKLSSPFEIWPAIQFGWFYVMISVLMNTALYYQDIFEKIINNLNVSFISSDFPIYVISFISGFADVDAIYIKASDLVATDKLTSSAWVIAIIIAVIMNTLVKILYIKISASKYLWKLMAYLIWSICIVWAIVTYFVVKWM